MAGFNGKFPKKVPDPNTKSDDEPAYEPVLPSGDGGVNPFAKQLASGDKEVRDATFAALSKWLGARKEIDMLAGGLGLSLVAFFQPHLQLNFSSNSTARSGMPSLGSGTTSDERLKV